MSGPASDATGLQWLINLGVVALAGLCGWAQVQINWLRQDNERTEKRAVEGTQALRNEFNTRYEDAEKVRDRQHEDNRAEQTAMRSLIKATADEATVEHRLMRASIEKMNERLSDLASAIAGVTKR
jgi:cytoskeletal protein RodZ